MKRSLFSICLFLIHAHIIFGQVYLSNPEHVVYDDTHCRYLVSNNGNGTIVEMNEQGEIGMVVQGLTELMGIHIINDQVYASCYNQLKAFSLETGEEIKSINLPVSSGGWLDGIISDSSGNVYVIDVFGRKVYSIDTNLNQFETCITGLPMYPQDLAYDYENNRLLIACWDNCPLYAFDIASKTLSEIPNTNIGYFDGILYFEQTILVSSHTGGGTIYAWQNNFEDSIGIIASGFSEPAGIGINTTGNILAIPCYASNKIEFIDLDTIFTPNVINQKHVLKTPHVYPNPAVNTITCEWEELDQGDFCILSSNGAEICKGVIRKGSNTINISSLESGIYFFILDINGVRVLEEKILIVK